MNNWPTKKLGEVLQYEQPQQYIVTSTEYCNEYETPVLTPGKSFVRGYTNEKDSVFPAEKLPVIIFDDFTTASKFVDFPFKVKSSAMKILHTKRDEADTRYLFYLMQTIKINHDTHKRYWISEYSKIEIPLPSLEMQKKIVAKLEDLLAKVSEAKKLRAETREGADNLLSAELHKIFEEGKKKGWEEKELGEISEIARGGSPRPINAYFTEDPNGINWIKIGDATRSNKYIYETKQKIKPEGLKKSRQVNEGDLLLSNSMSFGRPYIMKTTGAIHDGWLVIKPEQKRVSEEYLYQIFGAPQVISFVENLASGAVVKNLNINRVKTILILLPSLAEQKKIVAHLDSIAQKVQAVKELQNTTENEFDALEQSILSKAFSGELI